MEKFFQVYNVRETYHELGEYEIKVVLSPDSFKNGHLSEFKIVDSDGKPIPCEISKWGRKVNFLFKIDPDVSDGVAAIKMDLVTARERKVYRQVTFWIIKPD